MKLTKVAAICPTWERLDLVRQMAQSYLAVMPSVVASQEERQPIPLNSKVAALHSGVPPLVVVAQGHDDGTVGWCRNQGHEVIESAEPLGYARAVNKAVKESQAAKGARWLLLLNNDVTLRPGFWPAMQFMADHGFEIIGAKLLYPDDTIQHYGKWFTLDFYPFHVLRGQPKDHPMSMVPRKFPAVTFACVLVRKAIWDALGGLDEAFENGYEDDDFCLRAGEMGAICGVHPDALATHLEAQTTGKDDANKAAQWQKFKERWVDSGRIQWPLGMLQGWKF